MKEIKTISIQCDSEEKLDRLNIAEMTEFQGGLKARTDIDYDKIKLSIIKYGFSFPFFIWKSDKNYLLDGHGRFNTLCKMQKDGYIIPDLPVVYIDAKDKAEAKQKLLRLNSQYGKMTKESVLEFADDLEINFEEIALPDTVIDFTDGEEEINEENTSDVKNDISDVKEDVVSQYGEIYELGDSLLMCGDTTSPEDVNRLMNGEKCDMVFTDPPYNVAIGDKNKALQSFQKAGRITENIENDSGMTDEEIGQKLWLPSFSNMYEIAKDECAIYVTMPQGGTHMMMMMMKAKWQVKHELIWVKNSPTFSMGRLNYDYQHEPIMYGWKNKHNWYGKVSLIKAYGK